MPRRGSETGPEWIHSKQCYDCKKSFGLFRRDHHCRHCGQNFCGDCTKSRRLLHKFGYHKQERVCDACARIIDAPESQSDTSALDPVDRIEEETFTTGTSVALASEKSLFRESIHELGTNEFIQDSVKLLAKESGSTLPQGGDTQITGENINQGESKEQEKIDSVEPPLPLSSNASPHYLARMTELQLSVSAKHLRKKKLFSKHATILGVFVGPSQNGSPSRLETNSPQSDQSSELILVGQTERIKGTQNPHYKRKIFVSVHEHKMHHICKLAVFAVERDDSPLLTEQLLCYAECSLHQLFRSAQDGGVEISLPALDRHSCQTKKTTLHICCAANSTRMKYTPSPKISSVPVTLSESQSLLSSSLTSQEEKEKSQGFIGIDMPNSNSKGHESLSNYESSSVDSTELKDTCPDLFMVGNSEISSDFSTASTSTTLSTSSSVSKRSDLNKGFHNFMLSVSCRNLPKRDHVQPINPIAVLFTKDEDGLYQPRKQTEFLSDDDNPNFHKMLRVFGSHLSSELKISIYDVENGDTKRKISSKDIVGSSKISVKTIVNHFLSQKDSKPIVAPLLSVTGDTIYRTSQSGKDSDQTLIMFHATPYHRRKDRTQGSSTRHRRGISGHDKHLALSRYSLLSHRQLKKSVKYSLENSVSPSLSTSPLQNSSNVSSPSSSLQRTDSCLSRSPGKDLSGVHSSNASPQDWQSLYIESREKSRELHSLHMANLSMAPSRTPQRGRVVLHLRDGSEVSHDGSVCLPTGSIATPDGRIKYPDGSVLVPTQTLSSRACLNTTNANVTNSVDHPDRSSRTFLRLRDGTELTENEYKKRLNFLLPENARPLPDYTFHLLDGSIMLPSGSLALTDGHVLIPEMKPFNQDSNFKIRESGQLVDSMLERHPAHRSKKISSWDWTPTRSHNPERAQFPFSIFSSTPYCLSSPSRIQNVTSDGKRTPIENGTWQHILQLGEGISSMHWTCVPALWEHIHFGLSLPRFIMPQFVPRSRSQVSSNSQSYQGKNQQTLI